MAISYSWRVNAVKHGNQDGLMGVVQFVDAIYTASETVGDETYTAGERCIFEVTDSPDAESFVQLSDLTEEMVLSWVQSKIDAIDETELQSKQLKLNHCIESQKSSSAELESSTPWEPEPTD